MKPGEEITVRNGTPETSEFFSELFSKQDRSKELIADFVNGYATGWFMAVKECFRTALDIRWTERIVEIEGAWKEKAWEWTQGKSYRLHIDGRPHSIPIPPKLNWKKAPTESVWGWTQGNWYDFQIGDVLYDIPLPPDSDWQSASVDLHLMVQVIAARPAYLYPDPDGGENKKAKKKETKPLLRFPGRVVFQEYRPNEQGQLHEKRILECTQDEFVTFLQSGTVQTLAGERICLVEKKRDVPIYLAKKAKEPPPAIRHKKPPREPLSIYNKQPLDDRTINELIGLARGIAADGRINMQEAQFLLQWLENNAQYAADKIVNQLFNRVREMLADNILDQEEEEELLGILKSITGEMLPAEQAVRTTASFPLDDPPPDVIIPGRYFCLTGQFAYAPRRICEEAIIQRGGMIHPFVSGRVDYLVIGALASDQWAHTSYGRKIEKAMEIRDSEQAKIAIIHEDHWARYMFNDGCDA